MSSGRTDLANTLKTQVKLIRPGTTQLKNRFKNKASTYSKVSEKRTGHILSGYDVTNDFKSEPMSSSRTIHEIKQQIGNLELKRLGFGTEEQDRQIWRYTRQEELLQKAAAESNKNEKFVRDLDRRPFSNDGSQRRKAYKKPSIVSSGELSDRMQIFREKSNKFSQKFTQMFSNFELNYCGLTKEDIQQNTVEDINRKINKNLKLKNKQSIQERCSDLMQPQNIASLLKRIQRSRLKTASNFHQMASE